MDKETFYFSHDYSAKSDIKITKLMAKYGWLGYGLYWGIIEKLYQNANALPTDYEVLAYDMRCEVNLIQSVVENFGLFEVNETHFYSNSVKRRLDERGTRSQKARESAQARWGKNANALRTHSDSNAIKERKGKEIDKGISIPLWRSDFDIYLKEASPEFDAATRDKKFLAEQQLFYPNVDLVKTIYKSWVNFWGTEEGWANKKKSKSKTINWRGTIVKTLAQGINKVYYTKQEIAEMEK